MANEIYHKSNWGSPKKDGWGDSYFNPSATNKLYTRSDNYENVEGTDKALASKPDTQSVLMTPTAYSVGSMNSILPPYEVLPTELVANGDFSDGATGWVKGFAPSATQEFINGALVMYAGSASDNGNSLSRTDTSQGYNGKKYKLELNGSNFVNSYGNLGYLRLDGVYDSSNIISFGEGTSTIYFIAYRDFTNIRFFSSNSEAGYTIDNVSIKEVRNADFTFDRNSTATRVNKEGLIETVAIDTPRLDYPLIDGVVQSEPALLLEPARTNLITNSENFSSGYWNKADVLIESGYTAPDGSANAYKVTSNGSSPHLAGYPSINYANGRKSLWVRTVIGTGVIQLFNHNSATNNIFTITEQWQRFDAAHETGFNQFYAVDFRGASTTLSEIIIWGAQFETGSYATSYIPTSGSTVTRAAETANGAGTSDDFNDSEGVLYAEISALADDGSYNIISLSDNTANNFIVIGYKDTNNTLFFDAIIGGTRFVSNPTTIVNQEEFNKICLKYKSGDTDIYFNGFKILSSATTFTHSGNSLSELEFQYYNNTLPFYGKTKEVSVFKTALTDSELESLTSWDSFSDMATGQEYSIR